MRLNRDEYIRVRVVHVEGDGSSIAIGSGVTFDGRPVTFAGEPRLMHRVAEAIEAGDPDVVASVPLWSVLRLGARPERAS